ncbi:MAG: helix-turn-helix transcriptional regulator [Chitinophagaceae bacterium]|nr:helix-turn-helix transcriptional regulator [Chitinophagaceae bacterium]
MVNESNTLSRFIKEKRKQARLTQPELATKAGVGLRFVRDLEQGKITLKMDKVNQVLKLFGHELGPVLLDRNLLIHEES